jgi:GNAT superfamily N-acetyltransferase
MKSLNYNVRRAEPADLNRLVDFTVAEAREAEGSIKPENTVREGIRAALEDDSLAMYWVLSSTDSRLIGSISVVKEWSDWNAGFYWWIQSIFILPEFRGQGLMEILLEAVKEAARGKEAVELRLYAHRLNKRALKAYRKSGFSDSDYRIMTLRL